MIRIRSDFQDGFIFFSKKQQIDDKVLKTQKYLYVFKKLSWEKNLEIDWDQKPLLDIKYLELVEISIETSKSIFRSSKWKKSKKSEKIENILIYA